MRISLHWYNYDDLDLHMISPYEHVCYNNKCNLLDVDMNACGGSALSEREFPKKFSRDAVENIISQEFLKQVLIKYLLITLLKLKILI